MGYLNTINKSLAGFIGLLTWGLLSTANAEIDFIFIYKEKVFQQFDNNPPDAPTWWFASAGVTGDNQVTGGSVVYPESGGPITLTGQDGTYSTDGPDFDTQALMDADYPNGEFSLTIEDNGTQDFGPFSITGDTYPNTPYFENLEAIEFHDGSQDFEIFWNSFEGATADDKIIFQIFEPELEEEVVFAVLPGDAVSFNIPGGSFQEFFGYDMELFFVKSTTDLETPENFIGYISSVYSNVSVGSYSDTVNIPDDAVREAVKLELGIPAEESVTADILVELSSLTVSSDQPIDLTGLEFAFSLSQLTLSTETLLNFTPVTGLSSLDRVKLVAPQKEGLFFTHWSDGSQENPKIIETTGSQDFNLTAQYSTVPLSPFAGGYSYIVNGTVALALSLPDDLNVQAGDPYELRFNYLIFEDAYSGDGESSAALIYQSDRLAMEVELKIKNYRWILRSADAGTNGSINSTSLNALRILSFSMTNSDGETDSDFPFSRGTETIRFIVRSNSSENTLFNGPLKIPDSPDYVNWGAVTGGNADIISSSPNWLITLSTAPGPNQTYRIERHPSYLDLSQRIIGFATDMPMASSGSSSDSIDISWNDPHVGSFETSYQVWRATNSSLGSATLIAEELFENTFTDLGVSPGQQYYYWIRAIRDGRKADFSAPVTGFRAVATPEDIQASQGDFSDRIRVIWTRVSGAASYSVYRSASNDVDSAQLVQDGITDTVFDDFSIDTDDPYFYWVTSEAQGVTSGFSDSANGYRVANGITTVRASDGLFNTRVQVTWDAFPTATTYTIYRNSINDFTSATILAMDVTATEYDDLPGPQNQGIIFFYWVRPQIGAETGSLSNTDPGYIPLPTASDIVAWGDNDFDQTNVPLASLTDIVEIAAGANHSLALSSTGTVVGWGRNEFGQATPPFGLSDVVDIKVGYDHSLALKRDGTVVAWGRNTFGKATVPGNLGNVIDIEAGAEHSLALLADGSIVGWGANDLGQIDIPMDLTQVVQISAGGYHNLARQADGTVVAWGDNSFGQRDIPSRITQVTDIAAGWNHNLVILPNGTIDGWGDNSRGQLDFPADTQEPPQAKGFVIRDPVTASIVDISGGLFHSLALSANGELAAWGENKNSQTTTPENAGKISQIDAGNEHNLTIGNRVGPAIESLIPNSSNLLSGEDLVLRVRATGNAEISHQWFLDGVAIEGATSEALFLSDVSPTESGDYSVKVLSNGIEVSSENIQVVITENQATIANQTVRAIRSYNGTYLFSPVETNPPGLKLEIKSSDRITLPTTSGTHMISIDVDQLGYTAIPVENVILELEALADEPLRLIESASGTTIRYFAPEGFSSTLEVSSEMREWIKLAKIAEGDGLFHDFNLTSPTESFYRIVFEVPETN